MLCDLGERQQLHGQLTPRASAKRGLERQVSGLSAVSGARAEARPLAFDPRRVGLEKRCRVAPSAPSRQRDANATVAQHAEDVAPRATVPDEHDDVTRGCGCRTGEWQAQLHVALR